MNWRNALRLLALVTLLSGCSMDEPTVNSHLSKCLMQWHSSSEGVQGEYQHDINTYLEECMSAADFAMNKSICPADTAMLEHCYISRHSLKYQWHKLTGSPDN
jgi:hypothetical protein